MLAHASRKTLQHQWTQSAQAAFEHLQLPWLCPALCVNRLWSVQRRRNATLLPLFKTKDIAQSSSNPSPCANLVRSFGSMSLADQPSPDDYIPWDPLTISPSSGSGDAWTLQHDEYLPWDLSTLRFQSRPPFRASQTSPQLSHLPAFDPQQTIIIPDSIRDAPRRFVRSNGIGGDIQDMHQVFEAYIELNQMKKALEALRELTKTYSPSSPELTEIHNKYIGRIVAKLSVSQDQKLLKGLNKRFEVDLLKAGVKPNARTIALMIQGTLSDGNEKRVARSVRRYLALSKEAGIHEETRAAALAILNDKDVEKLAQCDDESFQLPPELSVCEVEMKESDNQQNMSNATSSPNITPQPQKGHGLTALKSSLSIFSSAEGEEAKALSSPEARQRQLELDTMSSAVDRWRTEHEEHLKIGINTALQSVPLGSMMWSWHQALVSLIKEELQRVEGNLSEKEGMESKSSSDIIHGPFLQYLPPEKLSAVTIISFLQLMSRDVKTGVSTTKVLREIGRAIEDESREPTVEQQGSHSSYSKNVTRKDHTSKARRHLEKRETVLKTLDSHQRQPTISNKIKEEDTRPSEWTEAISIKVGGILLSMLAKAANIDVPVESTQTLPTIKKEPAIQRISQVRRGRRVAIVRLHDLLAEKMSSGPVASAIAKHLPMIVAPKPWTDLREGGFFHQPVPVVRIMFNDSQIKEYVKAAIRKGDMGQVFAGLDVLGGTRWRINPEIFNVMLQIWNSGEAIANIPAANPPLDHQAISPPPDDKAARRKHFLDMRRIKNLKSAMHSDRCFKNFQLEIARAYLNEDLFFPHNLDFRGRAYPVPPHFNHMGADHCRGLLTFGSGRELGTNGLRWLHIHLANVYGYDKVSLDERVKFTKSHMGDVSDSADNPLGGRRWWLSADDPWQCLAACFELKKATEAPNPETFISSLPVHQDGSCNGLQHYAALGGDPEGARQVNLEPGERPADVYSGVAHLVAKEIDKDASQGDPLGLLLTGKIKRKVVKQTVMTNVYGVTFIGARLQVARQLEDLYPEVFAKDEQLTFNASAYIARKIFKVLSSMFSGAHAIQHWLAECASRICVALTADQIQWIEDKASGKVQKPRFKRSATNEKRLENEHAKFKSNVIWTTPLRMPVVQPYRDRSLKSVLTSFHGVTIKEQTSTDPVSKRGQVQAFPPNFVHSLDATHMLLSALGSDKLGLTFAAVHDSFWTHAADIDTLNSILRQKFVKMHSEDIIGRLSAELQARYNGSMYFAPIRLHSKVGKKISALRRSMQVKKKTPEQRKIDELLLETRRLRLLSSDDPREQAQGRAMVTPAKLFEERAGDEDLLHLEDADSAFGEIKESLPSSDLILVPELENKETIEQLKGKLGKAEGATRTVGANKGTKTSAKRRASRKNEKTRIWLPLAFPSVPKKGTFDVSVVEKSTYFFA